MLFFKNHFGMVVSLIIALVLALCCATTALIYEHLDLSVESIIRSWGTAFLSIMLTTIILPVKIWGDLLAGALKLKPRSLPFGLVSNIVPTLIYNTVAALVLVGVNVGFDAPFYWNAVAHSYIITFVVAYVISLGAEALAIKVAQKSCLPVPHGSAAE
ncbi:MAG: hypothetical protein LBK56_04455 [Gracilibacteraceae bacterium]|jgi:hypothetical protein|nr:hypothetical protein [Gracilibacteraceae bacterium]